MNTWIWTWTKLDSFVVSKTVAPPSGERAVVQIACTVVYTAVYTYSPCTRPCNRVVFCSLAVVDPRVGHTMDFLHLCLSSVILIYFSTKSSVHVLTLSIQAVRGFTGTWHCSLHYFFLQAVLVSSWCDHSMLASLFWQCLTVSSLLQLCWEPTDLFSLLSMKHAESFSVLSSQRPQDAFLHSFWVSSFHSRTWLQPAERTQNCRTYFLTGNHSDSVSATWTLASCFLYSLTSKSIKCRGHPMSIIVIQSLP